MTMVASGTVALAGTGTSGGLNQSIEVELGGSGASQIGLGDSNVRTLLGVPSGAISISSAYSKSNFTPHHDTFTTGSGTVSVPGGAVQVIITVIGGGGGATFSGSFNVSIGNYRTGGAGGAGGLSSRTISLVSGDANAVLSYSVAAAGTVSTNGTSGGNSTVSGTVTAGSISMAGNGGGGGTGVGGGSAGGPGGSASGGTTNTTGNAGSAGDPGGTGGQGVGGTVSGGVGNYGWGGNGSDPATGASGNPGIGGYIDFNWT